MTTFKQISFRFESIDKMIDEYHESKFVTAGLEKEFLADTNNDKKSIEYYDSAYVMRRKESEVRIAIKELTEDFGYTLGEKWLETEIYMNVYEDLKRTFNVVYKYIPTINSHVAATA